jgi:hypothetical protein
MILPQAGPKSRWLIIFCGLAIFFWSATEDTSVSRVSILGAATSSLTVSLWTMKKLGGKFVAMRYLPAITAVMGILIGVGASLFTAGLMMFKNVRHSHIYLDFPAGLMGAILERAPVWMMAGGLLGMGVGLAWLALQTPAEIHDNDVPDSRTKNSADYDLDEIRL